MAKETSIKNLRNEMYRLFEKSGHKLGVKDKEQIRNILEAYRSFVVLPKIKIRKRPKKYKKRDGFRPFNPEE
jgi:hypothetical protein